MLKKLCLFIYLISVCYNLEAANLAKLAEIALISLIFNLIAYKIIFPIFNLILRFFGLLYEKVLNILTSSRFIRTVYIGVILILFSLSVIYMPEFSFFPKMDRGEMVLLFETTEGRAVEEVDKITQKMIGILLEQPEVDLIISYSQVGCFEPLRCNNP